MAFHSEVVCHQADFSVPMEAVSRGREAGPWLPVPTQWDCHVGSHMGNEAPERGTKSFNH